MSFLWYFRREIAEQHFLAIIHASMTPAMLLLLMQFIKAIEKRKREDFNSIYLLAFLGFGIALASFISALTHLRGIFIGRKVSIRIK